ncbi:MAG TPA: cobalamin-binding protein [Chloroflexota bacterium]|nr:cobalamin-binding protein [Chloroflexota bacterium]
MRICSLVPSGTEIVCALGLADQLVGVSHRCDYPPEVVGKPIVSNLLVKKQPSTNGVGGETTQHSVYELDAALVQALAPDLILTQEVCEACAVPASLAADLARGLVREPQLFSVTASTLDDILTNIARLGLVVGREEEATRLVHRSRERIERIAATAAAAEKRLRVAFFEWPDPPWLAGNWIPELIVLAGGLDRFGQAGQRTRKVDWPEIVASAPEIVFLAPCGLTIDQTVGELSKHLTRPEWSALPAFHDGRVYVLDGSLWSRHGPRIVDGLEVLAQLIHPELFPGPPPEQLVRAIGR